MITTRVKTFRLYEDPDVKNSITLFYEELKGEGTVVFFKVIKDVTLPGMKVVAQVDV